MRSALLVMDLQKEYYKNYARESMDRACDHINEMIPRFRRSGLPVIWIQHVDKDENVVPGTEGFEFIDLLEPEAGEYSIQKSYGNAFNKTALASILEKEEIDTIIISGYSAEHCVLSTYRGSLDLDLQPVLLQGGLASSRKDAPSFVCEISQVISHGILTKLIEES